MMNLSRDYVLRELRAIQKELGDWVDELENPEVQDGGTKYPVFPDGVPEGMPMSELQLPIPQLRAELAGIAGRLEALITAS